MASPRFIDYFSRKLSWHYLALLGEDFFAVLGAALDTTFATVDEAVKQRLLDKAKDEALPFLAQNFNLEYPERFSIAKVRAYLASPWTHWEDAGT